MSRQPIFIQYTASADDSRITSNPFHTFAHMYARLERYCLSGRRYAVSIHPYIHHTPLAQQLDLFKFIQGFMSQCEVTFSASQIHPSSVLKPRTDRVHSPFKADISI
jgi:hypothetical protein